MMLGTVAHASDKNTKRIAGIIDSIKDCLKSGSRLFPLNNWSPLMNFNCFSKKQKLTNLVLFFWDKQKYTFFSFHPQND
jgi:hypothetical protein